MAKINISFDHQDNELGHYFASSKVDIIDYIQKKKFGGLVHEINSLLCNEPYFDITFPKINNSNFVFVAYSHGRENELTINGNYYVHSDVNSHLFINSFFYAMACNCGIGLGKILIERGAKFFIGYKIEAEALLGEYMSVSIQCDNYGIKEFLNGETLLQSFLNMKENFSSQIDTLVENGEALRAAYLRKNRDALVFYGDGGNLTKFDFLI